jgi:hypothetical protein
MGLMIHSMELAPKNELRDYYVYLLDFGWHESLGEVLRKNFGKMADEAGKNNFVVVMGTVGSHFENEVFSYHQINGYDGKEILPAIMITSLHPKWFKERNWSSAYSEAEFKDAMLLIPLRDFCKTSDDVVRLLESILKDIKEKKPLSKFVAGKKESKGRFFDSIILKPSAYGIGIDIMALIKGVNKRSKKL